jgi:predicted chitinase
MILNSGRSCRTTGSQSPPLLAQQKAKHSITVVKTEETKLIINRSERGLPIPAAANVAEEITSISSKVTVALLESVFPESARKNIEVNAPYLPAALQEFKISDKRVAAAIIATIAVETPNFEPLAESAEYAKIYEGKSGIGNINPGDGVRYRGRGYLQITGRANYQKMSERLGLGSRLLDSPDDANSPEVASRILVAYFADRPGLSAVLASGDRAVPGATSRGVRRGCQSSQRCTTRCWRNSECRPATGRNA